MMEQKGLQEQSFKPLLSNPKNRMMSILTNSESITNAFFRERSCPSRKVFECLK